MTAGEDGFRIVPYQPEHLRALALQEQQSGLAAFITRDGYAEKVAVAGPAWTALDEAMPIACAGFQMPWPGRAIAWAVLSLHAGRRMLAVTRAVTRALDAAAAERIEAHVLVGFDAGLRWAAALGFKREVLLRKFYRGEDYWSFVLLKNTL